MYLALGVILCFLFASCRTSQSESTIHSLHPAPAATTPLELCWVETALSFGFTGSSLLVRHPKGHILIDAGASSHFDEAIAAHPFFTRMRLKIVQGGLRPDLLLPKALLKVAEDPQALQSVIITHAHGDHLGGLGDLPGVPGWMGPEEIAFMQSWGEQRTFHMIPPMAQALLPRLHAIPFGSPRFELFEQSYDLFGDGSVVVVKLPGHTPGSIGVFVQSGSLRLFHVGDAVHDMAGIKENVDKPFLTASTDIDKPRALTTVALLHELYEKDRSLTFLPAHDRRQWQAIFGDEPFHCIKP